MQSALLQPDKKLRFNENHFQGYWVQLNTLIRRNDEADRILDGLRVHPLLGFVAACADNTHQHFQHATSLSILYRDNAIGDPPGTVPSEEDIDTDPIGCIRDFALATTNGTVGGPSPRGAVNWIHSRQYGSQLCVVNLQYRTGCKHIWETVVATFSAAEVTTLIAGLPYGSGPKLLRQV